MKKLFLIMAMFAFVACSQSANQTAETEGETIEIEYYGEEISEEGAISATELLAIMGEDNEKEVKLVATIEECCQKKGCWMKVDLGDGKTMRVTFKDYGFFVPMDAAGRQVVMDGVASMEETSVEALRHYAEDAGKSAEEIEAITEARRELVFEARGVILK
ncbi:MAG: DUF4920 domain-containing protein [Bacteroidia bacterium]